MMVNDGNIMVAVVTVAMAFAPAVVVVLDGEAVEALVAPARGLCPWRR
jgi:hypothetical protein